jgi:hypothetical protein
LFCKKGFLKQSHKRGCLNLAQFCKEFDKRVAGMGFIKEFYKSGWRSASARSSPAFYQSVLSKYFSKPKANHKTNHKISRNNHKNT